MVEKYTGDDRRYTGEVEITYNLKRCIHAEYCVNHLSAVFDKEKRPWINPDGAPVDQVVSVIELCPSGALHYDRQDGLQEAAPDKNVITVRRNGPLAIRGDLAIHGTTVALQHETRVTLCRCGGSHNKPFCDNTHKDIAFQAVEPASAAEPSKSWAGGKLTIMAHEHASLELQGEFEIVNEAGETLFAGDSARLCRCGGSNNKPFCDGTHGRNGFTGE